MKPALFFLGHDGRTPWVKTALQSMGYSISESPDCSHIILPMPAFDKAGHILNGPSVPDFLKLLKPGMTVLGGKLQQFSPPSDVTAYDLLTDELLTCQNAAITAEGALELVMPMLPVTLDGCSILVTGWGRIGKLLSQKLAALGAHVTVAARKPKDLAMIRTYGFTPLPIANLEPLSPFSVIFNTVPVPIFSSQQLQQTNPNCILIELASPPGGFDCDGSRTIIQGSGLPGKTAPKTAGFCLAQAIDRYLSKKEEFPHGK